MFTTDSSIKGSSSKTPRGDAKSVALITKMAEKARKTEKTAGSVYSISNDVYRALPDTIERVARVLDEGHERDAFLTGLLPVLAGGFPNAGFRYGGHWLSLNLYTAVVAPAGSGKGKMRHARTVGDPVNKWLHMRSRKRRSEWERKKESDEEDAGPEPAYRRLFLAADASAASVKENLDDSPHSVIFETEFKTLSTALGQEWGQFRDVLLKGFQNEPVEVDRKREQPMLIDHPAPSMAVSGTPGTFSEVIGGLEDGLFSRFAFYRFDATPEWKSQFGGSGSDDLQTLTSLASDQLKSIYRAQMCREEPLRITFRDSVKWLIDNTFAFLMDRWTAAGVNRALYSSLKRAAVRALRIAVIFHLFRHHNDGQLEDVQSVSLSDNSANLEMRDADLEVDPRDAVIGLRLALTYLAHALKIAGEDGSSSAGGLDSARKHLNQKQRGYLDALPDGEFPFSRAREIADDRGIPESTAKNWVRKTFKEKGLVKDVEHGTWEKVSTASSKEPPRGLSCLFDLFGLLDASPKFIANPRSYSGDGASRDADGISVNGKTS